MQPLRGRAATRAFIGCALLLAPFISGCGLFDSAIEWKGGPYALLWIDVPEDVELSHDAGSGAWIGRVEPRVFAVGWDGRYVVAQQHPKGDKTKTNFFIIDSTKDSPLANIKDVVIGPLSEAEFKKKSDELNLPKFTKILKSLQ